MLSPKTQTVNRRAFISAAAAAGAAAGTFALLTQEASAMSASASLRAQPGHSSALADGKVAVQVTQPARSTGAATFDVLKQIDAGELNIGYAEAGPADGSAVVLLHG